MPDCPESVNAEPDSIFSSAALANRANLDELSAKVKLLEAEYESVKGSLDQSQRNETKLKTDLETQSSEFKKSLAEKEELIKKSQSEVEDLNSQLQASEKEAKLIDTQILGKRHVFQLVFVLPLNTRFVRSFPANMFLPYYCSSPWICQ